MTGGRRRGSAMDLCPWLLSGEIERGKALAVPGQVHPYREGGRRSGVGLEFDRGRGGRTMTGDMEDDLFRSLW